MLTVKGKGAHDRVRRKALPPPDVATALSKLSFIANHLDTDALSALCALDESGIEAAAAALSRSVGAPGLALVEEDAPG